MKMKMRKVRGQRRTSRPKSAKRSVSVKGEWKAVELDPGLFSEEGLEGLVCFEELTSYRLVDDTTAVTAERDQKKDKKRKVTEEVDVGEETEDTSEPAKKKKRLSADESVRKESVCEEVTPKDDEPSEPVDPSEHDPPSKCVKPKAKKKKKNQEKGNTEEQPSSMAAAEAAVEEEDQRRKAADKKQVKNWTRAALSGSGEKTTDMSAWKDLFVPAAVLKALSALGFASPTPIQALVLPPAIRDRMDILGAAETGSGKTLAFGIPMIHSILEWRRSPEEPAEDHTDSKVESLYLTGAAEPSSEGEEAGSDAEDPGGADEDKLTDEAQGDEDDGGLGCMKVMEEAELDSDPAAAAGGQPLLGLVLTPTRELAVQVKHHIDAVAKFTDIRAAIVVGGMAAEKQRRMLKRRPEIVIATPGRLWDLIQERHPHLLHLRQLRCLVIDEADRMVERGHFSELESLLEMLNTSHFNPKRQTFVFSATLTLNHSLPARVLQKKKNLQQKNKVELLMEKVGIKSKPKVIDLSRKEATAETLTETQICCQKDDKDFFLYYFLLQHPGRTMVFANSIDCIKRLNALLVILDLCPLPLHANMHQKQRLKNLERFAERDSCVLLTTDVAARGLDIPDVQHVIHYQVPRTSETYVHRSGRTARATKEGLSLLLIGPDDMLNFKKIYRTLGKDEGLPVFPLDTKCMEAIKERVNLARSIEKIEFFNSRQKQHNSWFKQAAEAMDVDLDDGLLLGGSRDENADREQQMMVKGMKKHLKHLISQPVFKKVMRTRYPTQMGRLSLPPPSAGGGGSALARVYNQQTTRKTGGDVPAQQRKKKWRQRKKTKKQQQQDASKKV